MFEAKDRATEVLCAIRSGQGDLTAFRDDMARAVDDLNKAWDALTECLVRQRDVRDKQISNLMNQLAEARFSNG